jgi:CRISPR system Cascade subunit CasB
MTTTVIQQPDRKKWSRRRGKLGEHVAGLVAGLQSRVLREPPDPAAVSALARLRRGIGQEPGSDYTLEQYLLVPEQLLGYAPKDSPADTEYAVHDAVTLYALHQQSQRRPMHVSGGGLGAAVSRLVSLSEGADGIRRRFAALGTATAYHESIYHLRSLTTLLRGHEVPFDYGLLADDLYRLRCPNGPEQIRALWGREFFRTRPAAQADPTASSDAPEENAS